MTTSRPRFAHHRLDAYAVAVEAMALGHAMAGQFGRGYAPLADQLRRATQSVVAQIGEGAAKRGAERAQRFRGALAEANEAAAAAEAAERLGLTSNERATELLVALGRVCAMLTRLARA